MLEYVLNVFLIVVNHFQIVLIIFACLGYTNRGVSGGLV